MSDNKKEKNDNKRIKRIIYIIIAGLVVIASLVFVLWCLEIFTFGSKVDTKTVAPNGPGGMVGPPKNHPKKETFYDFEVNDGIKDRKASIAYHKLKSLTEAEKKKLEPKVYNRLLASQRKYAFKFTNTKNIGIIRVLPVLLLNNIDIFNKICDVQLTDEQNNKPSLFNLCIELACHMKMREENGNISLLEYNKYLYTLGCIAEKKDKLIPIDDLNCKAREEAGFLMQQKAVFEINGQTYNFSPLFNASNSIDKILPPKKK